MKKINNIVLTIMILIQPLLDTYYMYNNTFEIFGFKISTIIRYGFLALLFVLLFIQTRYKNKRKGLIIYFILLIIYTILHHINAINFKSLVPGNFNYSLIEELFYMARYIFPLFLIYYLNTIKINNKTFKIIILSFSLIVSISVIISNIFLVSKSSYYDYNITYNIFDWFIKDISYSNASTRGFFYATIVMTNLLLITPYIYNLYYKEGRYIYLTAIVCNMLALFMAGTKACTFGFVIIAILMLFVYLFFTIIKKELQLNIGHLIVTIAIIAICFALLQNSPAVQRIYLTNDMYNSESNNNQDKEQNTIISQPEDNKKPEDNSNPMDEEEELEEVDYSNYKNFEEIYNIKDTTTREKTIKKFIKDNYNELGITTNLFLTSYNFLHDYNFWADIILTESTENKANNRYMQRKIFERIKSINSSKMDDYFGLTYSRTSKIFNLERDFLYQYYSLGIIGVLLFMAPIVILLLICMLKMLKNRDLLNIENTSLCIGVGLILCIAYYSGNMLDNLGIIIILGFVLGYLASSIFPKKQEKEK